MKRLIEKLKLMFARQPRLQQTAVSGSASRNPYQLVWYRSDWSESKTEKNNAKYWEWEIMHNGFRCP